MTRRGTALKWGEAASRGVAARFEEVQRPAVWLYAVLAVALAAPLYVSYAERNVVAFVVAFLATALVASLHLRTRVLDDDVHVRLFPVWSRRYPRSRIVAAEPVRYRPLRDYGGWGLRPGNRLRGVVGWAWTMRGNEGVQVDFSDGRRVLLGSQCPRELADALRNPAHARD